MLDLETNKAGLKRALEDRGYQLHIVTTNLETEKAPKMDETRGGREQGQEKEGGGGQGGGKGRQDQERERR